MPNKIPQAPAEPERHLVPRSSHLRPISDSMDKRLEYLEKEIAILQARLTPEAIEDDRRTLDTLIVERNTINRMKEALNEGVAEAYPVTLTNQKEGTSS